jgi:hypothetical protein
MLLVAVALAAVIQAPPVVLADGPPRNVIVLIEGRAWSVLTVEIQKAGTGSPVPPLDPVPNPPTPPDVPAEWVALGRSAPVVGTLRQKLAAHYTAIGQRAVAGEWADLRSLIDAEMPAYIATVGADRQNLLSLREQFIGAYNAATATGMKDPRDIGKLWLGYGRGLSQAREELQP